MRRHMRFIFAAEMRSAWTPFGGILSQLNHVAVLLSLATLENAGFAMKYNELLSTSLADSARDRFPCDYRIMLSEVHEETRRAVTRDTASPKLASPSMRRFLSNALQKESNDPRAERRKDSKSRVRMEMMQSGMRVRTTPLVRARLASPSLRFR